MKPAPDSRLLLRGSLIAVSAAFEAGSLYFLFNFTSGTPDLLAYDLLHGAASALLALACVPLLPVQYQSPRLRVFALLFAFVFFIPILGALGLFVAVVVMILVPRPKPFAPFGEVAAPEFGMTFHDSGSGLRVAGMRAVLLDPEATPEVRLKSLIAIQSMPLRVAGPLLRRLLGDKSDDVRLVAYGLLDSQEKRINAMIREEANSLKGADDRQARLKSEKHLAELHWELIYAGLVQGDVREHTLTVALAHARAALDMDPQDAGLWLLHGRLLQAGGDLEGANRALNLAISCGVDENRALPYLAELAYARCDFSGVRELMGLLAERQSMPILAPLVRYWSPGAAA